MKIFQEDFLNKVSYFKKKILKLREKYPGSFPREISDFVFDTLLLGSQLIPFSDLNFFFHNYSERLAKLEKELSLNLQRDRQGLLFRLINEAQDKSLKNKLNLTLHGERTGLYAKALALDLGANPREVQIAGRYHDLGKLQVPREILLKKDKLTSEDWEYIFEHPLWSEKILTPSYFGESRILKAVRHHHEDWSGRGYPCEIAGTDIPTFARILRVADSFDSMTSERPYGRKKSFEEAVEEIEANEKGAYDPRIAKRAWTLEKVYKFFNKSA